MIKPISTADTDIRSSVDLNNEEDVIVHDKSNVLIIGPTGSGNFLFIGL